MTIEFTKSLICYIFFCKDSYAYNNKNEINLFWLLAKIAALRIKNK